MEIIGNLADELVACVGRGSNAIDLFHPFLEDLQVKITGIEGGGSSLCLGEYAARFDAGKPRVLQETKSYLLRDERENVSNTHSVSVWRNDPSLEPEHAYSYDTEHVHYTYATDQETLNTAFTLAKREGIIPALESTHAIAYAIKSALLLPQSYVIVIRLSGGRNKDVET